MSDEPAWTGAADGDPSKENARLRAVLGHCPRCVAVLGLDGRIAGFNREFRKLFDAPPRVGQSLGDLFEADSELLERVMCAARHDDRSAALLALRTAGGERSLELFAATLPAEGGEVVGIVLAGEDCTARAHEEAERSSLSNEIAERNSQATFALAQASLAHDLANALAVAVLSVQAIVKWQDGRSPSGAEIRSEIGREALEALTHASELVARARRGRVQVVGEARADVKASAERVVRLTRFSAAKHRVRVECAIHAPTWVRVGASELTQVLTNLVTNAIHAVQDAGRPGLVRIRVDRDPERPVARIHVRDDGVGIEPSRVQNLFEAYETGRAELGGTGLGLAIVRRIVESAGGHVDVVSTPGEGTDMVVDLPMDAESEVRLVATAPIAGER